MTWDLWAGSARTLLWFSTTLRSDSPRVKAFVMAVALGHGRPVSDSSHSIKEDSSSGVGRARNALSVPGFRYLWFNNIGYFLAANAQRFVFGWFVLDGLNRSERVQGLVVFTLGVPAVLFTLHAGVWADRWDRKRLLVGSQVAGCVAIATTALLVGTNRASLFWIVVLTLVAGTASAIGQPVRSALIPALVPRDQLFSAIALNAIAMTMSLILGSVLARLFGAWFGFQGAFWFMVVLFAVGLITLIPLVVPGHTETPPKRSIRAEMRDALSHVYTDHALRKLFGLLALASFTISPLIMVTMQAFVKEELGRDSGDAALPLALLGLGIAISSIIVMRKGDMKDKGATFMRAMMAGTALVTLMGRTTSLWQLTVLSLAMGFAGGFYINMNQGLIQANTPEPLMGRVMGLFTLISIGMIPFGALAFGVLGSYIGTGNTMTVVAPIGFVGVSLTYLTDVKLRRLN